MQNILLLLGVYLGPIPTGDALVRLAWGLNVSARDLGVPGFDSGIDVANVKLSGAGEPELQSRVRDELSSRRQMWVPVLAATASTISAIAAWVAVLKN